MAVLAIQAMTNMVMTNVAVTVTHKPPPLSGGYLGDNISRFTIYEVFERKIIYT